MSELPSEPVAPAAKRTHRTPLLLVFAKAPRLGSGKSRLARSVGRAEALRISRGLQRLTLRVAGDPRWSTRLMVAERQDLARSFPGVWPPPACVSRHAQGRGDLGQRLARAFDHDGPVAVIGVDCPQLTRAALAQGMKALRTAPFVLGPAEDGGFWFFAARRGADACAAFAGVRWSSPSACEDLEGNCPGRVARITTLLDIDTIADWRKFHADYRARRAYLAARPEASASRSGEGSP